MTAEVGVDLPEIYRERCTLLRKAIADLEKLIEREPGELDEPVEVEGAKVMLEIKKRELEIAAGASARFEPNISAWKKARDRWRRELGHVINSEFQPQGKVKQAEMF